MRSQIQRALLGAFTGCLLHHDGCLYLAHPRLLLESAALRLQQQGSFPLVVTFSAGEPALAAAEELQVCARLWAAAGCIPQAWQLVQGTRSWVIVLYHPSCS